MSVVTPPAASPGDTAGSDEAGARPGSILPAIRAIPESCYDNPTARGLAYFARDLVFYGLVVWALLSTNSPWLLVPLWVLSGFIVSALFITGHDCAHGALFRQPWLNGLVGRIAMLPSLHVYESWVVGHNRVHHGHTVKQNLDFVWHPVSPQQYADFSPLLKLRHRLEWSFLGSGAYYIRDVWWNKMVRFSPPKRFATRVRRDNALVAAFAVVATAALFLAGGSLMGGLWLWIKVLVVPFLGFCTVIGWAVHVHHIDRDIRWWGRHDWSKYKGQVEGTTVLHAPAWLNVFVHFIFEHSPHHVDTRIPMYRLPAASAALIEAFPDDIVERDLRLAEYLRNTRACKLYDMDAGEWLTFAEGRERLAEQPAG